MDTFDADGTPVGGPQLLPAVAAADDVSWKPVALHSGLIGISGGFSKKPLTARYIDVPVGDNSDGLKKDRFIHVNINAEWFLKGVGGKRKQKGELKGVNVLDIIRQKLRMIYYDEVKGEAEEEADDDKDQDQMQQFFEVLETPKKTSAAAAKKKEGSKGWSKSIIRDIDMPRSPECVKTEEEVVTTIVVYTPNSLSNRSWKSWPIYLRVDALDWLLQFAADEQFHQGVKRATADERDVWMWQESMGSAVAGLNLEWDFISRVWQGEFVSGPFKGTKRRFGVRDLTKDRTSKMIEAGILQPDTTNAMDENSLLKQQAYDVLLVWCDAISQGTDGAFEVEWELKEAEDPPCTPVKRARKSKK